MISNARQSWRWRNGINTYQYTNAVTVPNIAYFRVKKTDKDGKAAWSPVLKLSNKLNNS